MSVIGLALEALCWTALKMLCLTALGVCLGHAIIWVVTRRSGGGS